MKKLQNSFKKVGSRREKSIWKVSDTYLSTSSSRCRAGVYVHTRTPQHLISTFASLERAELSEALALLPQSSPVLLFSLRCPEFTKEREGGSQKERAVADRPSFLPPFFQLFPRCLQTALFLFFFFFSSFARFVFFGSLRLSPTGLLTHC